MAENPSSAWIKGAWLGSFVAATQPRNPLPQPHRNATNTSSHLAPLLSGRWHAPYSLIRTPSI